MTRRSLAVISAGLSQPSSTRLLADQLTGATERALRDQGVEPDVDVIALVDHAHDLVDKLVTGFASAELSRALQSVVKADGLVVVTPIFNASYSGPFSVRLPEVRRRADLGVRRIQGLGIGRQRRPATGQPDPASGRRVSRTHARALRRRPRCIRRPHPLRAAPVRLTFLRRCPGRWGPA